MSGMVLLDTDDDIQWLRDVHLPGLPESVKSAIIFGNEDSPEKITTFADRPAMIDSDATMYRPDSEGTYHIDDTGRSLAARSEDLFNNPQENNPMQDREENPNRQDVINAWAAGRKLKASALRTEGGKLWSYALLIGDTTPAGETFVYDFTGNDKQSPTTTTHVNAAKRVADKTVPPREGTGRYMNPGTPPLTASALVGKLKF